jgi:hypothetical protein
MQMMMAGMAQMFQTMGHVGSGIGLKMSEDEPLERSMARFHGKDPRSQLRLGNEPLPLADRETNAEASPAAGSEICDLEAIAKEAAETAAAAIAAADAAKDRAAAADAASKQHTEAATVATTSALYALDALASTARSSGDGPVDPIAELRVMQLKMAEDYERAAVEKKRLAAMKRASEAVDKAAEKTSGKETRCWKQYWNT